ncbi:hypothetical protein A3C23_00860 [Candidatus Roizmanbacteria bacterium RIFCSPHIGHO2_02_FULL_37_13b]|uniref:NAD-dependent epimerase/dehydratase domain-containing protein n=1 Tax=Candidatus Roizmanbacteria bacterium RIFCSPLOWO2_02_FULL_36_11 TaxID=1802071 RepID=A0A1F7JIW1_9BACT|nr:MAG: hypothetical protein A3C23_00860 [Candidatus Roizmanbacteria bacterium RIFCSPHIGHO2_02_FULL_37_13b]OGK55555.1 MAG: hypothetical protein A3H78_05325 [Candidatus Roizmanbacteria bacterium RIFCSPLOWO2_02_FULL_36_11]
MKIKNNKILITGGTGFIGSHLAEELLKKDYKIIACDIRIHPLSYFANCPTLKKVKYASCDIRNFQRLSSLIKKIKPDFVYHLAAVSEVENAYDNPRIMFETNVQGTVNVLEATRSLQNIKGVVIASSDKAYGKQGKRKYREIDPLLSDHPYELSKTAADMISLGYYKTYGLPVTVTRFGNVYGEGDFHFSRLIPDILRSIIQNKTLKIRSDGKHVRDYIYIKDVVSGYIKLMENIDKTKGQAFNFGSKDTLSVIKVIKIVETKLNRKIKYKIINNANNEIPYQTLNFNKVKKICGWQPQYTMTSQIKKIYEWYKLVIPG